MQDGANYYRRYLQGERNALEELVAIYCDALIRYAHSLIHDASAAEDIAEDCFVALILKRRPIYDDAHLKAYLFKAARNKCMDFLRRRRRQIPVETVYAAPASESDPFERELVRNCIDRLPEAYRDVLLLGYIEEFSVEECARIMKKSRKQVYNLLARARQTLKKLLIAEGYYDE